MKWWLTRNAKSLRWKKLGAPTQENYPENITPETFQAATGKLQEIDKILIGDKFQLFRCSTVLSEEKLSYDEVF